MDGHHEKAGGAQPSDNMYPLFTSAKLDTYAGNPAKYFMSRNL